MLYEVITIPPAETPLEPEIVHPEVELDEADQGGFTGAVGADHTDDRTGRARKTFV